jgi:hypothetical protein
MSEEEITQHKLHHPAKYIKYRNDPTYMQSVSKKFDDHFYNYIAMQRWPLRDKVFDDVTTLSSLRYFRKNLHQNSVAILNYLATIRTKPEALTFLRLPCFIDCHLAMERYNWRLHRYQAIRESRRFTNATDDALRKLALEEKSFKKNTEVMNPIWVDCFPLCDPGIRDKFLFYL